MHFKCLENTVLHTVDLQFTTVNTNMSSLTYIDTQSYHQRAALFLYNHNVWSVPVCLPTVLPGHHLPVDLILIYLS